MRRGFRRRGSGRGPGPGHVFLHHPAIAARGRHLTAADALFGHRLSGRGRVLDILARGHFLGAGIGGLFLGRGGGGAAFGSAARGTLGDHRQPGLGIDGRAFLGHDLGQHAGCGAGHLDRDLVGFQFAQHLVGGDLIADLLEPGGHRRLGHAFAKGGNHHVHRIAAHLCLFLRGFGACPDGGLVLFRVLSGVLFRILSGVLLRTLAAILPSAVLRGGPARVRALGGFVDLRQQGIGLDGRTFLGHDLGQDAGGRAGHLDRDLVGFQLAQHFIDRHGIAGLLEPCRDGRLGDGFAQSGHADFGTHRIILRYSGLR